jgi:hypothetical protein
MKKAKNLFLTLLIMLSVLLLSHSLTTGKIAKAINPSNSKIYTADFRTIDPPPLPSSIGYQIF